MKAKRPSGAPTAAAASTQHNPQSTHNTMVSDATTGLIDHFIKPPPLPPMPWEMPLELRQRVSKDPRTVKHLQDIDRWNNTPLQHVWARLRNFAAAKNDWVMTRWDVIEWLKSEGIESELVMDRLVDVLEAKDAGTVIANKESVANGVAALTRHSPEASVGFIGAATLSGLGAAMPHNGASRPNTTTADAFSSPSTNGGGRSSTAIPTPPSGAKKPTAAAAPPRMGKDGKRIADPNAPKQLTQREKELLAKHNTQRFNAIILCKYLELGLTTHPFDDLFIQHCFDQFDRPLGSVRLSKQMILKSDIKPPPVKKGAKKSGSGGAASPAAGGGSTTPRRSSSLSPSSPNSSTKKSGSGGGGKKKAAKGPFKMGSGATNAMIEPLKRLILRGEFELKGMEGNNTNNENVSSLPSIAAAKRPSVAANTTNNLTASQQQQQQRPSIGFASLNWAALDPRIAHRRALPVATGHTADYTNTVLLAMRKHYDTDLSGMTETEVEAMARNAAATISVALAPHQSTAGTVFSLPCAPSYAAMYTTTVTTSNGDGAASSPAQQKAADGPAHPTTTAATATAAASPSQASLLSPNARPITGDEITYEMFKHAFLDGSNSEWVAAFVKPLLECASKYFAPPHGELPLVSLRWLRDVGAVPVSEIQYDADAALLKEIEELGYDPWVANKKKKKGGSSGGDSPRNAKKK